MITSKKRFNVNLFNIILTIITIIYISPLYVLLSVSFKSESGLTKSFYGFPNLLYFNNFIEAYQKMHFSRMLVNSILVVILSLIISIVIGSLASYPIARNSKPFFKTVYLLILGGMIIPFQVVLLPLYKMMLALKLDSTYFSVILIYVVTNLPLIIFIYTGFIKTVPKEIEEAAYIDGLSKFSTFWKIIFPLVKTCTITVGVIIGISLWNEFMVILIFLSDPKKRTIPYAIYSFVGQQQEKTQWNMIFAGLTMSIIPILIVFITLQKHIVAGITSGSVKG